MRHVLFLASVGLWLATLSGCGGGDSSSAPAVAGGAATPAGSGSVSPGMQGSGSMSPGPQSSGSTEQGSASMAPGMQGSGSMAPGMQGSGSMSPGMQGSGSMSPGMQGSGAVSPGGMPSGSGTSDASVDSSAYQQQMANSAQGSQPPGATPYNSDSSAAMPGYGPGGMMPAGSSSTGPGYNPAGATPAGSSTSPATYPGGMMPGYNPQGASSDASSAPTPYGMGGQPGGDPNNPNGNTGYPGAGNVPGQQPAKPLTLADKAELAFRQGRDQDAIQYLYAHGVTADADAAKEVLGKMGWITPLKRPAMAVRWGIAVEYTAPRGYNGNIYPIGTTQNVPIKGAPGGQAPGGQPPGGMGDGGMGQGGMGAGQGSPQLQQLTGELGQKVVGQLQERIARGDFGQVMASLGKASAAGAGGAVPGGGMPGYMAPGGGSDMSGAGMASGFPGSAPGGFGGAPGQPQAGRPTDAVSLAPGIVLLGLVSAKDLREKGQKAGVDAVCVFDVVVTVNPRTQLIKNETTIHLHDLMQAKELYESKTLNNIQVQIERVEKKSDQDPVDKELESLFKFVDSNWRLGQLPAGLQADHVLNRLRILLGESHENPLPVLAEARMYQTRGLLQDNHFLTACQKLLGDPDGTQLVNGSEEEKLQLVAKWLPKEP